MEMESGRVGTHSRIGQDGAMSAPFASTSVSPLQASDWARPQPNVGLEAPAYLGGFAKLRGTRQQRELAADALVAENPASTVLHCPLYSFVFGNTSILAPLGLPPLPSSLDEGWPDGYDGDNAPVGVEEVIWAALAVGVNLGGGGEGGETGPPRPLVLSYRNNLRKLFGTAYDPASAWTVDAVAVQVCGRPVICLDIVPLPPTAFDALPESDRYSYWGYRFEALCAHAGYGGGGGGGDGGGDVPPARLGRAEWAGLFKRRLGGVDLLLAAETDGFCPDLADGNSHGWHQREPGAAPVPPVHALVELKTLRWPDPNSRGAAARALHAKKVPTWWVQAWCAGVAAVWTGGREVDGTLTRVDRIPTAGLPSWSAGQGGTWTPAGVVKCGAGIVEWIVARCFERPGEHVRCDYLPPPQQRGGGGGGPSSAPGELRARVVAGGDLPGRVRAALEEGVLV